MDMDSTRSDRSLRAPWPAVMDGAIRWYGGRQNLLPQKALRRSACGPVAAFDTLRYLLAKERGGDSTLQRGVWERELRRLCLRYFWVIPYFGTVGPGIAFGLNLCFRKMDLPYRARWCFSGRKLFDRIESRLMADIPVIMTVGPNFPFFWKKNTMTLYSMPDANGVSRPAAQVKAHFVTVTGMVNDDLCISSWGRRYLIRREDYRDYVRRHGICLTSNMIYIWRKV